jgi:hypothetical protein
MTALENAIYGLQPDVIEFLFDRNVCCYQHDAEMDLAISMFGDEMYDQARVVEVIHCIIKFYVRYMWYDNLFQYATCGLYGEKITRIFSDALCKYVPYGMTSEYSGVCMKCSDERYLDMLYYCNGKLWCNKCKKKNKI